MRTRVKVCCMQSVGEVRAAVSAGADALGFVGEMPSGPGPIGEVQAHEAASACPPGVSPVLLTSREDPHAIVDHARSAGVGVVQLVRHLDPVVHVALRRVASWLRLIQVVHVEDEHALELSRSYAGLADALLLDSGRPALTVAELGGTGRPHDWTVSRRIVQASPVPVWLAGGLTPGNVGEAIEQVNPFGVDLCTGVRTAGRLDARKLSAFFHAVRVAKLG